jgi:hypothetical protein
MHSHERIKHKQDGTQRRHCLLKPSLIDLDVEPYYGRDDDVDVERLDRSAGGRRDPCEPLAHDAVERSRFAAVLRARGVIAGYSRPHA